MGRCEHRYLGDVYAKGDIETKDGKNTIKEGAKPTHKECLECGASVGGGV